MEYTSAWSVMFTGAILICLIIYLIGQDDWWKF